MTQSFPWKKDKTRIMFVCMGNICRSPVAHAAFQKLVNDEGLTEKFQLESSGTIRYHVGEPADARMRATAASHGVTVDHRANHLKAEDLNTYDLILAMDKDNLTNILKLATTDAQRQKVCLYRDFDPQAKSGAEVPDPYYGGPAGFEEVFQIVLRTSLGILSSWKKH